MPLKQNKTTMRKNSYLIIRDEIFPNYQPILYFIIFCLPIWSEITFSLNIPKRKNTFWIPLHITQNNTVYLALKFFLPLTFESFKD